jgi:hypothetical protein
MPEITDNCLCGAVRYKAAASPVLVGICHCWDCQKLTGSAFGFLVGLPRDTFELRGTVKSYSELADSGGRLSAGSVRNAAPRSPESRGRGRTWSS